MSSTLLYPCLLYGKDSSRKPEKNRAGPTFELNGTSVREAERVRKIKRLKFAQNSVYRGNKHLWYVAPLV
jgi:hypothetical protein